MTADELTGRVAALLLRQHLEQVDPGEGTCRFLLDCLGPEEAAAVARAVLSDPRLDARIAIRLPRKDVGHLGLPEEILTSDEEGATSFRNAECPKDAFLLANVGDSEEQSLKEIVPVGPDALREEAWPWTEAALEGVDLDARIAPWLTKAIEALLEARAWAPARLARYVLRAREGLTSGLALPAALGAALPELQLPKDIELFAIPENMRKRKDKWARAFKRALDRGPFLEKLTPSQVPIDQEDLRVAFEQVRDQIPDEHHPTVEAFIAADRGWNERARALAECEWPSVQALFTGGRRPRTFNLGEMTLAYYDEYKPEDALSEEERAHLAALAKAKPVAGEEVDRDFYERHREELKLAPAAYKRLKPAWDRFVFGSPIETGDFVVGLALAIERLVGQTSSGRNRTLTVRCDSRKKGELRELNHRAGLYFAFRYRNLDRLVGRAVSLDVGKLFSFHDLVEEWRERKEDLNDSRSKAANQLKFTLELEEDTPSGSRARYVTSVHWRFDPDTIESELVEDWGRLLKRPLVASSASRRRTMGKGSPETVDLANARTFAPTYAQESGSLIPAPRSAENLDKLWRQNLAESARRGFVGEEQRAKLESAFARFASSYRDAVDGFNEEGLTCKAVFEQAHLYGELLEAVCRDAPGDVNREFLLRPLLRLGAAQLDGGRPTVVVAPWHPLRLAAMVEKARQVASLARRVLESEEVFFGDTRLFFRNFERELAHPFYPEVVVGWKGSQAELLALTDALGDYSLHELPVTGGGLDDTNENPAEGAGCVVDVLDRYLALQPHEQANLSLILYNCDSARLPQAVVDKIGARHGDDEAVRCQVVLHHRDRRRLGALYERIVESSYSDVDGYNASEATRDFMARLRIAIAADRPGRAEPARGRAFDLAFLQDVVARHASVEWHEEDARPSRLDGLVPPRWSRRRPAAEDDRKSVVYLCSPVQSPEGWAYLTALASFCKGDWDGRRDRRLLPARELNFNDDVTSAIFAETHDRAQWVVNFDELLDKRQLSSQGVNVIRYKHSATQGRNLIISSNASSDLLKAMLRARLDALGLGLGAADTRALITKLEDDANRISGDIVLRAAKRGRYASELIGLVLSRYLVASALGSERHVGWYYLDDYADWLGQREQQIADLLVLRPEGTPDGADARLSIVVTEAKYVDAANLGAKRRESAKQLVETVRRVRDAIFGSPERLDRELWLARLADLLVDGVRFTRLEAIDVSKWRRALREGLCRIRIRGVSHVFVSKDAEGGVHSEGSDLDPSIDCRQEVYGLPEVRELLVSYLAGESASLVRDRLGWPADPGGEGEQPSPVTTLVLEPEAPAQTPAESNATPEPAAESSPPVASAASRDRSGVGTPPDDAAPSALPGAVLDVLSAAPTNVDAGRDHEKWLDETWASLRRALQALDLQATLVSKTLTPNSALVKVAGSANMTVEKVLKRRSELLTTYKLDLVSVRPEPGVVSIAVARPEREIVRLSDAWRAWSPAPGEGNLDVLIGVREDDGRPLLLNPVRHAPHSLVAGTTGSGKSVLVANLILSIAATNSPAEARLRIIDPKMGVDYFPFEGLPHLDGPIIIEREEASEALAALTAEMDRRYRLMRERGANKLAAFNAKVPPEERLPVLWVIHDEFAEWMLDREYRDQAEDLVKSLAMKGRAAGIFLVFAAQRPEHEVCPLQIRDNLGNRLILKVASEGTSEFALGERGAERLLGKGHMIARLESEVVFAQVPFVDDEEATRIVDAIRNTYGAPPRSP